MMLPTYCFNVATVAEAFKILQVRTAHTGTTRSARRKQKTMIDWLCEEKIP